MCLSKMQIFIKTTAMLELTTSVSRAITQLISKSNLKGTVAVRTASEFISHCCRRMLSRKQLKGVTVCLGLYFRMQSVVAGKAQLWCMTPAHLPASVVWE